MLGCGEKLEEMWGEVWGVFENVGGVGKCVGE